MIGRYCFSDRRMCVRLISLPVNLSIATYSGVGKGVLFSNHNAGGEWVSCSMPKHPISDLDPSASCNLALFRSTNLVTRDRLFRRDEELCKSGKCCTDVRQTATSFSVANPEYDSLLGLVSLWFRGTEARGNVNSPKKITVRFERPTLTEEEFMSTPTPRALT